MIRRLNAAAPPPDEQEAPIAQTVWAAWSDHWLGSTGTLPPLHVVRMKASEDNVAVFICPMGLDALRPFAIKSLPGHRIRTLGRTVFPEPAWLGWWSAFRVEREPKEFRLDLS